jgi:hypothetical protein
MVELLGGAVAQLGECLTGSQEVVGSNPISSTILKPSFCTEIPCLLHPLFMFGKEYKLERKSIS